MSEPELVVLAGPDGAPCGTAPKNTVHTTDTPLHFAFSCYLIDDRGRVLITRRALGKKTWPGVWTNTACGHPGPGEEPEDAMRRRLLQELGITPDSLLDAQLILPDFTYRATDSSGIVEWELCPVFVARVPAGEVSVSPSPVEVDSWEWVDAAAVCDAVAATPFVFSPWMVKQLEHEELRRVLLGY